MESLRMERSKKRSAKSKRCRRVGPRWGDLSILALMNGAPPYQIKVMKRFCITYINMNIDWLKVNQSKFICIILLLSPEY